MIENNPQYCRREPEREKSPDRFLHLFTEVTDMKSAGFDWSEDEQVDSRKQARRSNIIGAIVIGSSTIEGAQPKDLDVLLVSAIAKNNRAWDIAEDWKNEFDSKFSFAAKEIDPSIPLMYQIESGRLDILGLVDLVDEVHPLLKNAIRQTENPLVFSYGTEYENEISTLLENIMRVEEDER